MTIPFLPSPSDASCCAIALALSDINGTGPATATSDWIVRPGAKTSAANEICQNFI
jgi:hypothetical protein